MLLTKLSLKICYAAGLLSGLTIITAYSTDWSSSPEKVWSKREQPLAEFKALRHKIFAPAFKKRDYVISDFGAKGDGLTNNTEAITKAILTCHVNGGGRVVVPAGKFMTGPIYLKSNVDLHLSDHSILLFSNNTADYPMVLSRWEGMDCMNYSPQIYAYKETNIALTGNGLIDGNADKEHWWPWKGRSQYGWKRGMPTQQPARDTLHQMMRKQVAPNKRIMGDEHYLRPYMFQPYLCRNVLISDVKMVNSPMWFISPVMCENVIIDHVNVASNGPNTDGCDPDACKNVLIKNSYFDTGDDCIAIKSGRDEDGRNIGRSAENHIIENCVMKDGHGGVVIGSEIAGGAQNIYVLNCRMSSPALDRLLRVKTSSSRGGVIRNVFLSNIKAGTYRDAAVSFDMFYESPGKFIPIIKNFWIENITVEDGGRFGLYIRAYKQSPVTDLKIVNCKFNNVQERLSVDHVANLTFKNFEINGQNIDVPDSLKNENFHSSKSVQPRRSQ